MQTVTSTPYKIAGQAAAGVCDGCVTLRQALNLAPVMLFAAMSIASAYIAAQEGNTANLYAGSGSAIIGLALGLYQVFTGREEFGEKAAKSALRKDLSTQGHKSFLTGPLQLEKMPRDSQ